MNRIVILAALAAGFAPTQAPGQTGPAVTAVLDGAAYTSNLAPGSIFVVKGTALSPAGITSAPAPSYPLTLNGVRITITPASGGLATPALMVYAYNANNVNQLAAVLPSATTPGNYDLRVESAGLTSAPIRVLVTPRKPGLITASSDGAGPAQATLDGRRILARNTNQGLIGDFETRPARPGERVDLWGTGFGADLASDSGGTSGDQTAAAEIRVIINGFEVTPVYAGRSSGYPGLDQIVFTLPASTAINCRVDLQVRAGTILSNYVTLPVAPASSCPANETVRINEVESSGGVPGDWVELYNPGPATVNLANYIFKDNDDSRNYRLPASAVIPPGGYYLLEEADFAFGLGSPDMTRLYRPDGSLADSYSWVPHAATTYGRCPNGTGPMVTTVNPTKGTANACGREIRINEVESEGGTPGDWVELFNPGDTAVDLSGYVFRGSNDSRGYTLPAGSVIAAGGYLVLEEAAFGFGLGAPDGARLFDTSGALADSYSWTTHAATTYGRCPNGSGAFTATLAPTKGAANACPAPIEFLPWPGATAVEIADNPNTFGGNLSGLTHESPTVLWGARNGPGSIFRLLLSNGLWTPDPANNWTNGKPVRYPDGSGDPDAEGITFAGGALYVSTERNNAANTVSRNSVLRFDPAAPGATLTATHEWNLTADLPVTGPNLGMEAITFVPDTYLTARGLLDESKNRTYNPADYPNHGTGLFLVGLEANGMVYAYALNHTDNSFTRIATISTGLSAVMDLHFDRDSNDLWAVCDDTCQGRSVVLRVDSSGRFSIARRYERPTGMPNLNNEGFTLAPTSQCVNNLRPALWADDSETGGHAIRRGSISCSPL